MQVLEKDGKVEPFRAALKKMAVASIGPTASERLRQHDWPIDLEPSHPKMGVLVKETSEQVHSLLFNQNLASAFTLSRLQSVFIWEIKTHVDIRSYHWEQNTW